MKIVIPTDDERGLGSSVAEHFGRCNTYTFLDENGRVVEIIGNTSEHMGGTGLPPELMKKHGANVLLCRGLGPRALDLCRQFGIDVYVCQAETVREIFEKWKNKKIEKAGSEDVCEEHRHEK
ncbi:MAG: NifB/NifX family molybdenum-iron cluster-binding protein [Candidatus Aenigmatarchaeota archaeon]